MAAERVQKILAQAGIASRRKAEELISSGQVTINGKVAKLGDKAQFGKDAIKVNGKLLHTTEPPIYIAFYKPKNVISSMVDPQDRPSLGPYFNSIKARIYPVGRLDFGSEGLILLTNDGAFAEKLTKSSDVPRVYHLKVRGHPTAEMVERLSRGGRIQNKLVKPFSVRVSEELTSKSMIEIVMLGAGVDLKAYLELKGMAVDRVIRISIGQVSLRGLEPGKFRHLRKSQVEAVTEQPELGMRQIQQQLDKSAETDERRKASAIRRAERAPKAVIKAVPQSPTSRKRATPVRPIAKPSARTSPVGPVIKKRQNPRRAF